MNTRAQDAWVLAANLARFAVMLTFCLALALAVILLAWEVADVVFPEVTR